MPSEASEPAIVEPEPEPDAAGGASPDNAWPQTVDEAVERILSELSPEDRSMVRATAEEDLILFHHGWGTGIRNTFGLWSGNQALLDDCGEPHPDGCSTRIIHAVWTRLQDESSPLR